jgi:aminoglycoside 3-N-acetyltransferase
MTRAKAVLSRTKRAVKRNLNRSTRWWYSQFRSFSPTDLIHTLLHLGVRGGDVVLAHVAYNEFYGFKGRPTDVVKSLQAAVTASGTLMMPSMPFTGSAVEYVRSGEMFDVARTPSQMGLVTELFRRLPGTIRSLHPTHPILANGPRAHEMTCDHLLARTPCGEHSPFAKLLDADGKIALLGSGIGTLTFYHYLEEVLEDRFPESPFTSEAFDIAFRGGRGDTLHVHTRLYDPGLSGRRRLDNIETELRQRRQWRERRLGRAAVVVLEARAVSDAVCAMAERGTYCYV